MLNVSDFIHPEDEAALRELESIPALSAIVKKIMEIGYENITYGINLASSIRLSPTQLPDIYNRLPPICEQLGIAQPEFYLEMNLIFPMAACRLKIPLQYAARAWLTKKWAEANIYKCNLYL